MPLALPLRAIFLYINWSLWLEMPFGVITPPRANDALTQCLISLTFELRA